MNFTPFDDNGDAPGAAAAMKDCLSASVCGNTLVAGGQGFVFQGPNRSALILNNNFSNATYRGIGYFTGNDFLNTAQIFGNTLNEGVTFHVQLSYTNSFGWFLGPNIYLDTNSNSVAPFCDPLSSSVHIAN
jgi:hypothetical protein